MIHRSYIDSIFSSINLKMETMPTYSIKEPYSIKDPYGINMDRKEIKLFELTYKTDKNIKDIDELEFQIANDYITKKFGMGIADLKLDELKKLYPELFLI